MFRNVLIPFIILAIGALGMVVMISSASSEERQTPEATILTVDAVDVVLQSRAVMIQGSGAVRSAQILPLSAQVSGVITELSPNLEPGGRFQAGEVLARIDSRDYRLAVAQEAARVQQAALDFRLAQERQTAAQREWELLGNTGEAPELAARKPQLEAAELALESAKAGQERAELNLSRTLLKAPFPAMIQSEDIELGQLVGPGQPIMTLLGTDEFWVRVSIPAARLDDIIRPDGASETLGRAWVRYRPAPNKLAEREAKVKRLEASLDAQARTAALIISIEDPLRSEGMPILPGAYVDVDIEGKTIDNVAVLPASALINGEQVLLATMDNTLEIRPVELGWRYGSDVFVTAGLSTGERVITTPISFPIVGAPLNVQALGAYDGE
ncbi:MAG: efflux RND transporter periplasmic adaptor subunit [Myxococcota bacterium]|nr:efflux RND transporter periplasmic adaptor subunit [Myxococcota bacterium]